MSLFDKKRMARAPGATAHRWERERRRNKGKCIYCNGSGFQTLAGGKRLPCLMCMGTGRDVPL